MTLEKFTKKSTEALQDAKAYAIENSNPQIEQAHLFLALLTQKDGLIPQLFKKSGVDITSLVSELENAIHSLPQVSGENSIYCSPACESVLVDAEKQASGMGDEYVSVEHLMLALFRKADTTVKEIISAHGPSQ